MDAERERQLEQKAAGEGLSDEEAVELGRLIAEERGEEYANAQTMLASGAPQEEDTPSEKKKRRLLGRHRDRPMTTQVKPEFDWARQQQIPSQR